MEVLRRRLLLLAGLARRVGGLLVARLLRDPLQQLVARDLEVLSRVAVAGVAPGFLAPGEVEDALHQGPGDPAGLLDERRRRAVGLQPLLHPLGMSLGLELV